MIATLWLRAWAAFHRARLWFPVGWDRYRCDDNVVLYDDAHQAHDFPCARPRGHGGWHESLFLYGDTRESH